MASAENQPAIHINADVAFYILSCIPVHPSTHPLWLWTSARQVSRDFRDAVERVWIQKHLPKTYLNIALGHRFNCNFDFSHVSPTDRSLAVFAEKDVDPRDRKEASRRLKAYMKEGNPPHRPKITVVMRREVNDTWIPGLQADWDRMEITCDWRGLVSEFMREERETGRRREILFEEVKVKMLASKQDFDARGEEMPVEEILEFWTGHTDRVEKEILPVVRHERLVRNVTLYSTAFQQEQLQADEPWDEDEDEDEDEELGFLSAEKRAWKRLKDHRYALGFAEFSDEEEEQEEEEEDRIVEDSNEEDEEEEAEEDSGEEDEEAWEDDEGEEVSDK